MGGYHLRSNFNTNSEPLLSVVRYLENDTLERRWRPHICCILIKEAWQKSTVSETAQRITSVLLEALATQSGGASMINTVMRDIRSYFGIIDVVTATRALQYITIYMDNRGGLVSG